MARIRSIKPEFATSLAIADLSRDARLHFILLWTFAADDGLGVDDARLLKAALWPLDDDMSASRVDDLQAELARAGRISRYEVAGRRYFSVRNFAEHQHPQKPKPSGLPDPSHPDAVPVLDEYATATGPIPSVVVGEGSSRGEVVVEVEDSLSHPRDLLTSDPLDDFDAWTTSL